MKNINWLQVESRQDVLLKDLFRILEAKISQKMT